MSLKKRKIHSSLGIQYNRLAGITGAPAQERDNSSPRPERELDFGEIGIH